MIRSVVTARKRLIALAAILVLVVSIGAYWINLYYLSNQVHTISTVVVRQVGRGNSTYPGFSSLSIASIGQGEKWAISVKVTARPQAVGPPPVSFCVISDGSFAVWATMYNATKDPGPFFPSNQCIAHAYQVEGADLGFIPSWSGTWDVYVENRNDQPINATFYPLTTFPGITNITL